VVGVSCFALPKCGGNQCAYTDVACEGNVMVYCGADEQGGGLKVQRRACDPGTRCTIGHFPHGLPDYSISWCFDDLGPDPRCEGQIGICAGDQPLVCQDGHALQGSLICAGAFRPCGFDATDPGSWPACLGVVDAGSGPTDPCEDRGDAATYCPIWFPPCDGTPASPCFNAWRVSSLCCSLQGNPMDAAQCSGTPFRRVDGSIQTRVGGFVGCQATGMIDENWCCTETGSP